MFTKAFTALLAAVSVIASPIDLAGRSSHDVSIPRFNDWHGLSSLHGFDDFYGWHNFAGVVHKQVVLKQKHELVCHRRQIEVVQQRLVVLQEIAKKIITEQICEVETQTVVFSQFHGGLGTFHHDLRRKSGRRVGYDAHIAGLWHGLFDEHGSLTTHDLGFRGHDVGKRVIVATGHDWDDFRSPPLVESAYDSARKAVISSGSVEDVDDVPEVSADSADVSEVSDASEAPGPEDSGSEDDAEATVSVEPSASASASDSAPSASASAANIDPATAP